MPAADPSNPPFGADTDAVRAAKGVLRAQLRAARTVAEPESATAARLARALQLCAGNQVIALYASADHEPDTWGLLDELHAAGHTVLLPMLGRRPDGTVRREPDWATFTGRDRLRIGYADIPEPAGPSLGAQALSRASLIWCAGLAATPSGDRLGTGGGWYDRALRFAAPDALIGVLLRDAEVLPALPVESFDRPVGVVVTEARVLWTARNGESMPGR
ncbi:MAG: 5-formyltetrahydrofolate cyclo-ligase [Micropruina sp.]|uniref:5-formyltetrahydrofolate cyclo-ligase n=1 Tax=Micropruina sp. TaxID=2737536 RepID=UPI0039E5E84A